MVMALRVSLEDLPQNVLVKILSHLDGNSRTRTADVCTSLRALIRADGWRTLGHSEFVVPYADLPSLERAGAISSVTTWRLTDISYTWHTGCTDLWSRISSLGRPSRIILQELSNISSQPHPEDLQNVFPDCQEEAFSRLEFRGAFSAWTKELLIDVLRTPTFCDVFLKCDGMHAETQAKFLTRANTLRLLSLPRTSWQIEREAIQACWRSRHHIQALQITSEQQEPFRSEFDKLGLRRPSSGITRTRDGWIFFLEFVPASGGASALESPLP